MPWVDFEHTNTSLLSFIGKKAMELSEAPAMETTLSIRMFPHFYAVANMSQVLKHKSRSRGGILNNPLTQNMVAIPVKPRCFSTQLLQVAFSTFCSFGLQFTAKTKEASIYFFPVVTTEELTVRCDSGAVKSKINADNFIGFVYIGFRHMNNNMQPESSFAIAQIGSSNGMTGILDAIGRQVKRNIHFTCTSRETRYAGVPVQFVCMSLIITNRTKTRMRLACFATLRFAGKCRFQRHTGSHSCLDNQIAPHQRQHFSKWIVRSVMQLNPILFIVLPAIRADCVECGSELPHGLMQRLSLFWCGMKLYFYYSFHAKSIAYMPSFCKY